MANRPQGTDVAAVTAWAHQATETLGLQPLTQEDVTTVLKAGSQAAAGLTRSAGPVAMYLAGVLLAKGHAENVAAACQMIGRLMDIPELSGGIDNTDNTA